MDMTWVTDRIAVGGGIWTDEKMVEVARAGITHIIDMQIEWDDTELARPYGIRVLWNPTDDDLPSCFSAGLSLPWRRWTIPSHGCSSTARPGCIGHP